MMSKYHFRKSSYCFIYRGNLILETNDWGFVILDHHIESSGYMLPDLDCIHEDSIDI